MKPGDRVTVLTHYRCYGVVGGWEPVRYRATVLKVNKKSVWVQRDGNWPKEKVARERVTT